MSFDIYADVENNSTAEAAQMQDKTSEELASIQKELSEYRELFNTVNPLLTILDEQPELASAIANGKITQDLVQDILAGNLTKKEAADITEKAKKEVAKAGDKNDGLLTPEEAAKIFDEKIESLREEIKEKESFKDFQERTTKFINSKADFYDYSQEIDQYMKDANITDVAAAYYAVKGMKSEEEQQKDADIKKAEYEKRMALNAIGGGSRTISSGKESEDLMDTLIASKSNPNSF